MRLLVVGAGATGGYFGGRLAKAGRDVTFLVRERRAEQLRAKGLTILSPQDDITVSPNVVTADALDASYDAILLSVKAYSLGAALKDMAPAVGADTVIVPLLNGMRHMDIIASAFGEKTLAGGLCSIATALDEEGRILHMSPFHTLVYGERTGERSQRMERFDAMMQNAGFDGRLSSIIEQEMWEKWTMLSTLAGVTCLMRGSIGDIAAAKGGADFVNRFLGEVVSITTANGHAPRTDYLAFTRDLVTAEGSTLTSSMFRDLRQNNPIEADEIIGDLLERGKDAQIDTPLLAAAYTSLTLYQNLRS